ncbi:polyprenol monophosphomannose synthase [Modestobacter sp. Leaf380]|uniref:polyprenol monophosphomannose synthase n=1 Tax=Modestobacter sp. Leaf380 TaxID=1736356 RepID=UPI000AFEA281|nr:polyprenol monophosphomannose synthase [Modestobacter sp. Leaf380]
MDDERLLVLLPTYDERESLPRVVRRIRDAVPGADVLVVDDASPDGTGAVADGLARFDPHVHVLHRGGKAGLGAAYLAGFAWGLQRGYDVLVEMDADGSHQPEELPRLLDGLTGADVVLGSRWVPGGRVVDWPLHRRLLSRGGSAYARWALGLQLRDVTGGYRAFRREVLEELDLTRVASQGYCFQIDLAWRALRAGCRVAEVPITFVERTSGASKMSGSIVGESLVRVTGWAVAERTAQLARVLRGEPTRVRPVPVRHRRADRLELDGAA